MEEKSFGAVIFRKETTDVLYLLIYKKAHGNYKDIWDFPRGIIENNEKPEDVAKREIFEETGLKDLKFMRNFNESIKWFYKKEGKLVNKTATYFLAETKTEKVKLSEEHDDFKWCDYNEAKKLITFTNTKKVLEKAENCIKSSLYKYIIPE